METTSITAIEPWNNTSAGKMSKVVMKRGMGSIRRALAPSPGQVGP